MLVGFNSCVDLKQVHNYAIASSSNLQNFESLGYSFNNCCINSSQYQKMQKRIIESNNTQKPNPCSQEAKLADSATNLIYNKLKDFFDGIANLSNNVSVTKLDTLTGVLSQAKIGNITITKDQADAYSAITKTIMDAATNAYRAKKVKQYIQAAKNPIDTLLDKYNSLLNNLETDLRLNDRAKLHEFYIAEADSFAAHNNYAGGMIAARDYYKETQYLDNKMAQIIILRNGVTARKEGYNKISDNMDRVNRNEIKTATMQYASSISNLIISYNKLKK